MSKQSVDSYSMPDFRPSAETELLCQDVRGDASGRVFAHLLRQVDVARQQNAHIIREQMSSAGSRDEILSVVREQVVALKRHEEHDAVQFAAIKAAQAEMLNWRKTWFGRRGVGALVLTALLYIGYDALLRPMLGGWIHHKSQPTKQ